MHWRISVIIILFLATIAVARAEEPNPVQQIVITVNDSLSDIYSAQKDFLSNIGGSVLPDDVKVYVNPKLNAEVFVKRVEVGVRITF